MKSYEIKDKLIEIGKKYEFYEYLENIDTIRPENVNIHVAFLGEFSSGKSTLINALLGKKILPMFEEPTTAVITEIKGGERNCYSVVSEDDDGSQTKNEISIGQLSEEISTVQPGKKVLIELNGIPFLNGSTVLIDTPGVSSIQESHDDVTFGYLPVVDVAFICMNITVGVPTNSFISFLKKFPNEILSKIYFILNFSDMVSPSKHEKLLISFKDRLSTVFDNPKIFLISALNSLKSRLETKNNLLPIEDLTPIENIIKNEVPNNKAQITEKRLKSAYIGQASQLEDLLNLKNETLSWSTPEIDKKIESLKCDMDSLKNEIKEYRLQFEKIKEDCIFQVKPVIESYADAITSKVAKSEPVDFLINAMIDEIKLLIEKNISKIKEIELKSLNCQVSDIIQSAIENESRQFITIADLLTDAITFMLTFWVIPGGTLIETAGAGGATAPQVVKRSREAAKTEARIAKSAEKTTKVMNKVFDNDNDSIKDKGKSQLLEKMEKIGTVIKEINPLEKIKNVVLPYLLSPALSKKMSEKMSSRLNIVFSEIEIAINNEIEVKYIVPQQQKNDMLKMEYEIRENAKRDVDKMKTLIEKDITILRKIVNN